MDKPTETPTANLRTRSRTVVGMIGKTDSATDRTAARAVATAADSHVLPWKSPRIGRSPWQWTRMTADGRGNCRGYCRRLPRTSVVIAALPWQWPRVAKEIAMAVSADFRGLPWLVQRILPLKEPRPRAVATTVAFAVEVP